jgi:hypothetical protein
LSFHRLRVYRPACIVNGNDPQYVDLAVSVSTSTQATWVAKLYAA